ncbi:MAG: ABC transporter ATP-binding protein [Streptococcaceae bacterium]|nr:ABC transporter ATP-binding protein [Streptococcaceae bacterium]
MKNQEIFKDISLTFEKGKAVGLVGLNGSGKSMLLKAICGFITIDSGEITIDDEKVAVGNYLKDAGIIIEHADFLYNYTGLQNLQFLAEIQNKISDLDILSTLKKVGLEEAKDKKVKNYSLGMKQRLRIAQAIMEDPQILILDEPFNGLDKKGVEEVRKILLELKKQDKTILMTSHNSADIEILCDEVYELERGELI